MKSRWGVTHPTNLCTIYRWILHRRYELDECRKRFNACIHAKGRYFSI